MTLAIYTDPNKYLLIIVRNNLSIDLSRLVFAI